MRARFSNVGDLKLRAPVKVAGVTIGRWRRSRLVDYFAEVELAVDRKVAAPDGHHRLHRHRRAAGRGVRRRSRRAAPIGNLAAGERITHTEPALNVGDLIGRYAFGNAKQGAGDKADAGDEAGGSPKEQP